MAIVAGPSFPVPDTRGGLSTACGVSAWRPHDWPAAEHAHSGTAAWVTVEPPLGAARAAVARAGAGQHRRPFSGRLLPVPADRGLEAIPSIMISVSHRIYR